MAPLRPVPAEARLTLVEHLGELRGRLFTSLAIVIVAFAFTYWQNSRVLDVVNAPLKDAQVTSDECDRGVDPIRTGECFDRALSLALSSLRPLVNDLPAEGVPEQRQVQEAVDAIDRVAKMTPEAGERKPVTLGVAEPFFQTINVALYAAVVLTLPLLLYQLYAFLIPALTRRERQAVLPLLLGVPFLFYTGVVFGYFLALPRAVDFLQNFNAGQFDILVQARDYYKFVLVFLAGTGLVFQVPVVVIAISRLGIVSAARMRRQRGIVAVAAAVISAIITPTPDAVTMLMVMVPFLVLFEVSVAVAAVLERRTAARLAAEEAEDEADPWPSSSDESFDDPPLADDWVEPVDDPAPTDGERPDPRLLGDPDGPRVEDQPPPPPGDLDAPSWPHGPSDDDWLARADELDDADPFVDDDTDENAGVDTDETRIDDLDTDGTDESNTDDLDTDETDGAETDGTDEDDGAETDEDGDTDGLDGPER